MTIFSWCLYVVFRCNCLCSHRGSLRFLKSGMQYFGVRYSIELGFPGGTSGKEPACQSRRCKRDKSIPRSGRSPGGGHSNPLQYSCLENPVDRGAWWAAVHRVAKSQTRLKRPSMHSTYSIQLGEVRLGVH